MKAWKVEAPHYDPVITAALSRDSVRRHTLEALRWDNNTPRWVDIRVTRAPEFDHLAARAWKEHVALAEVNGRTGQVTICDWMKGDEDGSTTG